MVALCMLVAAWSGLTTADAASSGTVVGAIVPSATALSTAACASNAPGVTALGSVLPGSLVASTTDCTVTYGSSNDTAMLRMYQGDGAGSAFWRVGDQLDTAFDGDGMRRHDLEPGQDDQAMAVHLRADGTTVTTGARTVGGVNSDLYVARYLPDGSLDPSFGTAGIALGPDLGTGDSASDIVELADGKLVVSGTLQGDFAVLRFTASGVLDTTFNTVGYRTFDAGGGDSLESVDVDSQGRIVAAGITFTGGTVIMRLTPTGGLDTSFAGDGTFEIAGPDYYCARIEVDSQDRPLCAGYRHNGGDQVSLVRRFTSAGAADPTFGTAGVYELGTYPAVDDRYNLVAEHPGGGYVLAGQTSSYIAYTQRLTATGGADATWDGDGFRTYASPWAQAVFLGGAILPNGNVALLTGVVDPVPATNFDLGVLVVAGSDGAPASWYGTGGGRSFDLTANEDNNIPRGISVGADGRVAIVGWSDSATNDSLLVMLSPIAATDFAAGVNDWDTGATSVFGACLSGVTVGAASAPWTVDGGTVCAQTDADAWRPIAATSGAVGAKVSGRAATGGADASVSLRFGFRASASQRPGDYQAPITFEAIAPNA